MNQVDLISPLPRDECVRRLKASVSSAWSLVTSNGVVGSVDANGFRIRKKIYYRNALQLTLNGALSDANGGTRIQCEFAGFPFLPVLILAAVVVALAVGVATTMLATHPGALQPQPLIVVFAPLGVLPILATAFWLAYVVGSRLARQEPQFLLDFLHTTLEAKELG